MPRRYAYEQPLINDRWVMAFDGTRVKVRERNSDGSWRITKKGEDYFRYNKNEYLPSVPYLIQDDDRLIAPRHRKQQYMPLSIYFTPTVVRQNIPVTVGHQRQARVGNRPLHANDTEQLAEVREATLADLRSRETTYVD